MKTTCVRSQPALNTARGCSRKRLRQKSTPGVVSLMLIPLLRLHGPRRVDKHATRLILVPPRSLHSGATRTPVAFHTEYRCLKRTPRKRSKLEPEAFSALLEKSSFPREHNLEELRGPHQSYMQMICSKYFANSYMHAGLVGKGFLI